MRAVESRRMCNRAAGTVVPGREGAPVPTSSPKGQVESIVRALEGRGARAAPIQEATDLALSHPEAVADLARATIRRVPGGGTFLDAALGYLPEGSWDGLVRSALDALEEPGDNEAACSVLAYASLQAPPSLHPHLGRIFRLTPNARSYYEDWPWRESGTSDLGALRQVIEGPDSPPERRLKAWRAMLQTRHPEVLTYALAHIDPVRAPSPWLSVPETVRAHLHLVGYHRDGPGLRRLCPDRLFHVVFPDTFFEGQPRPPWLERVHPTWRLGSAPDLPPLRFGGHAEGRCSSCGGRLHRLLGLDPVPDGLAVAALRRLELATCLSCLGWERTPLFYRHGEGGEPEDIGHDGPRTQPRFPVGPLREAEVRLAITPRRWRWQDWALSNSRENLNRVGGEPCWVQDAEYPGCPACGEPMGHLMQLDSDLPTAAGDEWLWGSGGIGYVSWCDRCKVSGFLWQCT